MTLLKRKEIQPKFQGIKTFCIENNFKKKEEERGIEGEEEEGKV